MPTTEIKLNMDLRVAPNGTKSVATDQPDKAAALHPNDSLIVEMRSNWPTGAYVQKIEFFTDQSEQNAFATWQNTETQPVAISRDRVQRFSVQPNTSGQSRPTSVKITDVETVSSDDDYWYKVYMSDGAVLDPELINKTGQGGAGWVDKE